MNIEEKLSIENKENYELYLKRMTESMKQSTKGLVPFFARFSKCALDVVVVVSCYKLYLIME